MSAFVSRSFASATSRRLASMVVLALVAGCEQQQPRPLQSREALLELRNQFDEQGRQANQELTARNLERIKAEHDAFAAGRSPAPPVVDILIISGGGDWGAFGAGFLKGWGTISGEMGRPREFDAVTGVSTGALIAPFAFIGDDASIQKVVDLYRNPKEDWVKPRGLFTFISSGQSYAEIPGLERELDQALDVQTLRRIAEGGANGRMLAVNTTNVDMQEMHAWDVTREARRAVETNDPTRVRQILLASSAIPAAFPARLIDDQLYVDGGITANIIYGGKTKAGDGFISAWNARYPDMPLPKVRYWVIFNNEKRWPPVTVQPTWAGILGSTTTAGTRSSTVNSMRLLFANAEIARLKHNANVEVRVVSVPDGWVPPNPKPFDKESMNALADMGERMGADPTSWQMESP